jgi:hypothetical protein
MDLTTFFQQTTGKGLNKWNIPATSAGWVQFLSNHNPLNFNDQDLSDLMVALADCQKQYVSSIYTQAKTFFANLQNMPAVREAIQRYGLKECQSSWIPFWTFYYSSLYFAKFPLPSASDINCEFIKPLIVAVKAEQTSLQEQFTKGFLGINEFRFSSTGLTDRLGDLTAMYAQLNCDVAIQQQTTQQDISLLSSTASTAAASAGPNYSLYAIYGIAGLLLLTAVALLLKKRKKVS